MSVIAHKALCVLCVSVVNIVLLAACAGERDDRPLAVYGLFDPMRGGGATATVSEKFGPAETERLHVVLNSPQFRKELAQFHCGDPIPSYRFAVALYDAAAYRDRLVEFTSDPYLMGEGRERCLRAGLSYLWDRTVRSLDRGVITNPGYKHPDGRVITDEEYRIAPMSAPICDCSKRDSGLEWVTYPPVERPGAPPSF
jgi:hypothetical protein